MVGEFNGLNHIFKWLGNNALQGLDNDGFSAITNHHWHPKPSFSNPNLGWLKPSFLMVYGVKDIGWSATISDMNIVIHGWLVKRNLHLYVCIYINIYIYTHYYTDVDKAWEALMSICLRNIGYTEQSCTSILKTGSDELVGGQRPKNVLSTNQPSLRKLMLVTRWRLPSKVSHSSPLVRAALSPCHGRRQTTRHQLRLFPKVWKRTGNGRPEAHAGAAGSDGTVCSWSPLWTADRSDQMISKDPKIHHQFSGKVHGPGFLGNATTFGCQINQNTVAAVITGAWQQPTKLWR